MRYWGSIPRSLPLTALANQRGNSSPASSYSRVFPSAAIACARIETEGSCVGEGGVQVFDRVLLVILIAHHARSPFETNRPQDLPHPTVRRVQRRLGQAERSIAPSGSVSCG